MTSRLQSGIDQYDIPASVAIAEQTFAAITKAVTANPSPIHLSAVETSASSAEERRMGASLEWSKKSVPR